MDEERGNGVLIDGSARSPTSVLQDEVASCTVVRYRNLVDPPILKSVRFRRDVEVFLFHFVYKNDR